MMNKPFIIYVSGAPGSGKTTLAKVLSEYLCIPHISSDLIHGGIAFTQPAHDRKQTLDTVFVPTMIDMAQRGASFVVDHVLQKRISEADIIDKLRHHATIINVHTKASNPIGRYVDRIKASGLPSIVERREHLLGRATLHTKNLERTFEPLDLDTPLLIVHTDDGYEPDLETIITFIENTVKVLLNNQS